ncbi:MAG: ThiF family adenylyltransferase [Armatimonadetes bacterium]|nr:ThiF family adenylyltransferase [Armatimonadota bacterium]MDE2206242.1 ThiF family adenylyltransferase [Armatimonadota bacterium]
MSTELIARSSDLKRLRDEGYDIDLRNGYLLVKNVPYVTANRELAHGILVSALDLEVDQTKTPGTHVAFFCGAHPCNPDGSEIAQIKHGSQRQEIFPGFFIDHSLSNKPAAGYSDYYAKITTYVRIISAPAQAIDTSATAITKPVIGPVEEEYSVFHYADTAATHANILMTSRKLQVNKVAIVGLGGTGSYVLDLIAKTLIREIHLYDGDVLEQRNAFRAPGAPSAEDLKSKPLKVEYYAGRYAPMRKGISYHSYSITTHNVHELDEMDFVFICVDKGGARRVIVDALEAAGRPFIDVGIGVTVVDHRIRGSVRSTLSVPGHRDHFRERASFAETEDEDDYDLNIQIADLNALNATLAVIRWKKLFGYYVDERAELDCTYTINNNLIFNNGANGPTE